MDNHAGQRASHDGENHGSPAQQHKDSPSIAKDRECPYCHQLFTSSSLGRHLDLYIKEKNPKAPDGVHIVDEIRRMRSKITRRHARLSTTQKARRASEAGRPHDSSSPASPAAMSANEQERLSDRPSQVEDDGRPFMHKVNWHATGVMSHLPPRQSGQAASSHSTPAGQQPIVIPNIHAIHTEDAREMWENKVTEKAAELALKEVLRSVQSAQVRASEKPLFNFDFFSLNFPAICLQLLPAPKTIFSTTPSPTPNSWPLLPPGHSSYEAASDALSAHIRSRPDRTDKDPSALKEHLTRVYNHWKSLSEQHQQEAWQLELMRALTSEMQHRRALEQDLERSTSEIEHLRAQMEQVPEIRQYAHWYGQPMYLPAGPYPFMTSSAVSELARAQADFKSWDADRLLAKWRGTILRSSQQTNAQPGGSAESLGSPLTVASPNATTQPARAESSGGYPKPGAFSASLKKSLADGVARQQEEMRRDTMHADNDTDMDIDRDPDPPRASR